MNRAGGIRVQADLEDERSLLHFDRRKQNWVHNWIVPLSISFPKILACFYPHVDQHII